jgi:hypothetical protein
MHALRQLGTDYTRSTLLTHTHGWLCLSLSRSLLRALVFVGTQAHRCKEEDVWEQNWLLLLLLLLLQLQLEA